eukprot:TRINITY_DN419_c0_g1_i4.p1 TRINITY_DN419_c0_g1~~TRINITY_DN419_c0_g1_i4.p1  ORF type:complete len:632 (-),score=206.77 TRINITY_DN419_c0_g1_i4:368-2038(-)
MPVAPNTAAATPAMVSFPAYGYPSYYTAAATSYPSYYPTQFTQGASVAAQQAPLASKPKVVITRKVPNKMPPPAAPKPTAAPAPAAPFVDTAKRDASINSAQWPPKLRQFVEKSFETCTADTERNVMEQRLKQMITDSIRQGIMWTYDWEKEPVPTVAQEKRPAIEEIMLEEKAAKQQQQQQQQQLLPLSKKAKKKQLLKQNQKDAGEKRKRLDISAFVPTREETERRKRRKQRFGDTAPDGPAVDSSDAPPAGFFEDRRGAWAPLRAASAATSPDTDDAESVWAQLAVVGTSTALEKDYLRTSSVVDPETVRPESVLKQTKQMLVRKWRQHPDYHYTCEQLKSIRQDLMVQHIKDAFTVKIYEFHARLALQNADMGEFNQCQNQLYELYKDPSLGGHEAEFTAYRILFTVAQRANDDFNKANQAIPPSLRRTLPVVHALQVSTAVNTNNYYQFFKLYKTAPNLGVHLMEQLVPHMRLETLKLMCRAYRPTVPLSLVQRALAFADLATAHGFAAKYGAVFVAADKKDASTDEGAQKVLFVGGVRVLLNYFFVIGHF